MDTYSWIPLLTSVLFGMASWFTFRKQEWDGLVPLFWMVCIPIRIGMVVLTFFLANDNKIAFATVLFAVGASFIVQSARKRSKGSFGQTVWWFAFIHGLLFVTAGVLALEGTTDTPAVVVSTAFPTTFPTNNPTTAFPTASPNNNPTTASPTNNPTTASPTASPNNSPTTASPTNNPTTASPTNNPTTASPTNNPTLGPTAAPTLAGCCDLPPEDRPGWCSCEVPSD
jgi:hypothetical protein